MGFFDWVRGKEGKPVQEAEAENNAGRADQFSTHISMDSVDRGAIFDAAFSNPTFKGEKDGRAHAMDSLCDPGNNPFASKNAFVSATQRLPDSLMSWYAGHGFIGFYACALFSQDWLIEKACLMPANDAVRNGWKPTINDGNEETAELLTKIAKLDKKLRVQQSLVELIHNKRVFGFRIALFVIDSDDPDYYLKPYNPDGIKPGSYRGISQVDPTWMTPFMGDDSVMDPASIHFYEPTWWQIGSKRYHRTHLIIVRHAEVPDIIKPSYLYGGVSLTQQIFERIYAAERTANEGPLLAMTKRMNIQKVDLASAFSNPERFRMRNEQAAALRDNYGVKFINTDELYEQHETSLTDVDTVTMTQYQLVSAISGVPATKLMGTSPKGFGASGDYEVESYRELLAGLQENDGTPFLERHYEILSRSEFGGKYHIEPVWNPLDEPTEKDIAEINKIKADTYAVLQQTGAVDANDIRDALTKDAQSDFAGMSADMPDDLDTPDDQDDAAATT